MATAELGLSALTGAILIVIGIIAIIAYVYQAIVWSTIAKKLKYKKHWLAWIPIANFFLMPILAKKNWTWGFIVIAFFLTSIPIVGWVLYAVALIFSIYWLTLIFKQRKYSPWLVILLFIPLVNFVILGFLAWADRK